ncbi:glycoside hydrolase family 16 protein [Lacisediminimonas sp.]|uniref:glycoside hydrolase family 16 protein n=1 Tax=Lacisediminimonas sp. TaxID=3060582 RepID=UPI00271F2006|nr:glycoside hydrolase family 16 protein [Lacisediminimonas sp.]MDO8299452.1 glycoside hydrolase family 16 protein [Lacisediminimonas sp.]
MTNASNTLRILRAASAAAAATVILAACGGGGGEAGAPGSEGAYASTSGMASGSTASDGPAGQDAASYSLTFNDDFDGFNASVWNDKIWYEAAPGTKNYEVEDGKLKIWPERDASGNFFNRTIDTDGKYYQTYGYFEVEAKLPVGKGTWPAFWLFNHIDNRRPEIDVMEAYAGGGPDSGWSDGNLHPTAYGATIWLDQSVNGGFKMVQTPDLSAGFHKYGLKWEANKQTFYFDGKEVFSADVSMGDPMYLMLDLWYGSASGQPDGTTPTGKGNSYEVNYVRAWQFK